MTRWDLPYRYGSRLFVPSASLHVGAPAALFFVLGLVDAFILVPYAGGQITSSNAVGLPWSLLLRPVFVALYFWMPHAVTQLVQQFALAGGLAVIFVVTIVLPAWLAHVMMRPGRQAALREVQARRRRDHGSLERAVADSGDVAALLSSLRSLDEVEEYIRHSYPVLPSRRPALLTVNAVQQRIRYPRHHVDVCRALQDAHWELAPREGHARFRMTIS